MARFSRGQSGNPKGRPKARRPGISAFDIVFDKTLTVTHGGVEKQISVDLALQLQTYQAALKGNKPATRQILKMLEKREAALAKRHAGRSRSPIMLRHSKDTRTADPAMLILGIAVECPTVDPRPDPYAPRLKLASWAVQAALSRPGRRAPDKQQVDEINWCVVDPTAIHWPKGSGHE